jgi:hypothetical protein
MDPPAVKIASPSPHPSPSPAPRPRPVPQSKPQTQSGKLVLDAAIDRYLEKVATKPAKRDFDRE